MELRKVEQELENISSEWKALRRKRPRFQDDAADGLPTADYTSGGVDEALFTQMPSWKELQTKVNDDDLFPEDEDEDPGSDVVIKDEGVSSGVDTTNNNNNESNNADGDTAGYSEFGMCLAPSSTPEASGEGSKKEESSRSGGKNGGSIFDRYAAKSAAPAKPKDTDQKKAISPKQTEEEVDVEEEVPSNIENAEPKSILAELESIQKRFLALGPKIEKFMTKLKDRDPVTKKPRYGAKTIPRVKHVIRIYKALEQGVAAVFEDTGLVSSLRSKIQQHTDTENAKKEALQSQEQLEAERIAKEKLAAEERANQQRLLEEQRKRDEEKELARLAEEARKRRVEEEQRALDAEKQADRELLDLVPTLGAEGVREQIGRMRETLKDDKAALDVALGSLYTLFEQIVRKPEEVNFRRVRRDHPKFMQDIGRHVGGREVLIAAGFKLEKLDGVPSFFSKEPHIESDMDGWSDWFDTLKKTLAIIEEEMLK